MRKFQEYLQEAYVKGKGPGGSEVAKTVANIVTKEMQKIEGSGSVKKAADLIIKALKGKTINDADLKVGLEQGLSSQWIDEPEKLKGEQKDQADEIIKLVKAGLK